MRRSLLLMTIAVLCLPATAAAQGLLGGTAPAAQERTDAPQLQDLPPVRVDSASPRASLLGYLLAARAGDHERAAHWLDQSSPDAAGRAPELARRLKAVLDAKLWIDLDRVSALAVGDTADGLPRNVEEVGVVAGPEGRSIAIRLTRAGSGAEARWVFSAPTVDEVDALYGTLPDNWIREHLPDAFLVSGPFDILRWQWLALLVLVPLAFFVGLSLASPTRALLRRLASRTDVEFDDALVAASRGPLILLWSVLASRVLLRWIALAAPAQAFVVELQKALATVAVFWLLLRAIGVLQNVMPSARWTETHPALRSLIPLGARIGRLLVFAAGVLTVIAQFGYPIATILAGLGIGGIAVALGAQKSLEHFFGSVSIGVDQPFRVGDWVNVNGVQGAIEAIGLRSTRLRTIDRTVITIPNGALAEAQTENFGERERIRFATTIGVEYGTSSATMRLIRDEIERLLRAHPKVWPERVVVRFIGFGASSLDIELLCWLQTTAIDEFKEIREGLLLAIMEIVEGNGTGFAFPTRTVHLKRSAEGSA
jgi:MscS family membrane protein